MTARYEAGEEQEAYERAIASAGPRPPQTARPDDDAYLAEDRARRAWLDAFSKGLPRKYEDDKSQEVWEWTLASRAWQGLPTATITDPAVLERAAAVFRLVPAPSTKKTK